MAVEPQIIHLVEMIDGPDGEVLERYNYLLYRFATEPETVARCYLDEVPTVSVITLHDVTPQVRTYLHERFTRVLRLTAQGYVDLP